MSAAQWFQTYSHSRYSRQRRRWREVRKTLNSSHRHSADKQWRSDYEFHRYHDEDDGQEAP